MCIMHLYLGMYVYMYVYKIAMYVCIYYYSELEYVYAGNKNVGNMLPGTKNIFTIE